MKSLEDEVIKKGILKHDLYYNVNIQDLIHSIIPRTTVEEKDEFLTREQVDKLLKQISDKFQAIEPVVKKGALFSQLAILGGTKCIEWSDDEGIGLEQLSDKWAEDNLEVKDGS